MNSYSIYEIHKETNGTLWKSMEPLWKFLISLRGSMQSLGNTSSSKYQPCINARIALTLLSISQCLEQAHWYWGLV